MVNWLLLCSTFPRDWEDFTVRSWHEKTMQIAQEISSRTRKKAKPYGDLAGQHICHIKDVSDTVIGKQTGKILLKFVTDPNCIHPFG
jgi:hypothetical protein